MGGGYSLLTTPGFELRSREDHLPTPRGPNEQRFFFLANSIADFEPQNKNSARKLKTANKGPEKKKEHGGVTGADACYGRSS